MRAELAAAKRNRNYLILAPVFLTEMLKKKEFAVRTFQGSFRHILHDYKRIVVCRQFADIVADEDLAATPCDEFVHLGATRGLWDILVKLSLGERRVEELFGEDLELSIKQAREDMLDHVRNRDVIGSTIAAWRGLLNSKPDLLSRLRNKDFELLADLAAEYTVHDHGPKLLGRRKTRKQALDFLRHSLSTRIVLHQACFMLDEICFGGFDTKTDKKITNDLLDGWYVNLATLCQRLVSDDARANRIHGHVLRAVDLLEDKLLDETLYPADQREELDLWKK